MYKYTLKEDGVNHRELSLGIATDGSGRLLADGTAFVSVLEDGSVQINKSTGWETVGALQADGKVS